MRQTRIRRGTAWLVALVTLLVPTVVAPRTAQAWYFDQETGHYYARARIYNPHLGRFLQRDPNSIGVIPQPVMSFHGQVPGVFIALNPQDQYGDGMNPYQYVQSNPVNRRDPSGMFSLAEVGVRSGAYAAMAGGTLGWMRSYANYADEGSQWQQATAFFKGAGIGGFTGLGMGLMAGAIGATVGSLSVGITAVGLMTSPAALGLSVAEYQDADTYGERLMAGIDIGLAGTGMLASHMAMFAPVLSSVRTPHGLAQQSSSAAAMAARDRALSGATLWRRGNVLANGGSGSDTPQFWALEHPANAGYAGRYGLPATRSGNPKYIQSGKLRPGAKFITRESPRVGANPGGGIEIVVEPGGVIQESYSVPGD